MNAVKATEGMLFHEVTGSPQDFRCDFDHKVRSFQFWSRSALALAELFGGERAFTAEAGKSAPRLGIGDGGCAEEHASKAKRSTSGVPGSSR